jgi:hypothetical protein
MGKAPTAIGLRGIRGQAQILGQGIESGQTRRTDDVSGRFHITAPQNPCRGRLLTTARVDEAGRFLLGLQATLGFLEALPGRIPLSNFPRCQVRQRFGQRGPTAALPEDGLYLEWTQGSIVEGRLSDATRQPRFPAVLMTTANGNSGISGEEGHQSGNLIRFSIRLTIAVEGYFSVCRIHRRHVNPAPQGLGFFWGLEIAGPQESLAARGPFAGLPFAEDECIENPTVGLLE